MRRAVRGSRTPSRQNTQFTKPAPSNPLCGLVPPLRNLVPTYSSAVVRMREARRESTEPFDSMMYFRGAGAGAMYTRSTICGRGGSGW